MGNCIRDTDRRWPRGVVPYRTDDVSADIVARAINAWEDADVGVRFVPYAGPTDPGRAGPHIVFAPGGEPAPCTSKIGRVGVGQRINCDLRESRLDTLIHEIGHALGLQHEHQRFDRGNHVAVIEDNIVAGYRLAYDRLSIDDGLPHGAYDFDSIMHYPETQFAVDFTVNVEVPGLSTPHPPALALFGRCRRHLREVHRSAYSRDCALHGVRAERRRHVLPHRGGPPSPRAGQRLPDRIDDQDHLHGSSSAAAQSRIGSRRTGRGVPPRQRRQRIPHQPEHPPDAVHASASEQENLS